MRKSDKHKKDRIIAGSIGTFGGILLGTIYAFSRAYYTGSWWPFIALLLFFVFPILYFVIKKKWKLYKDIQKKFLTLFTAYLIISGIISIYFSNNINEYNLYFLICIILYVPIVIFFIFRYKNGGETKNENERP